VAHIGYAAAAPVAVAEPALAHHFGYAVAAPIAAPVAAEVAPVEA
jgi:hypothetical protein